MLTAMEDSGEEIPKKPLPPKTTIFLDDMITARRFSEVSIHYTQDFDRGLQKSHRVEGI